jgi:hypothetical protein
MFARWLYGHPLCGENDNPGHDADLLMHLTGLYDSACVAEERSGTRDNELIDACIGAVTQCLTQKSGIPRGPIEDPEGELLADDKYPGKAVILRQLVYGEYARMEGLGNGLKSTSLGNVRSGKKSGS